VSWAVPAGPTVALVMMDTNAFIRPYLQTPWAANAGAPCPCFCGGGVRAEGQGASWGGRQTGRGCAGARLWLWARCCLGGGLWVCRRWWDVRLHRRCRGGRSAIQRPCIGRVCGCVYGRGRPAHTQPPADASYVPANHTAPRVPVQAACCSKTRRRRARRPCARCRRPPRRGGCWWGTTRSAPTASTATTRTGVTATRCATGSCG
jgi:hypothetical protein